MDLTVIIPVYNEKNTIEEIMRRVHETPWDKELIIVDDYSTDGTRAILQALPPDERIRILYHDRNQGKGAALRTGIQHARGGIVIIQDADLEYDPQDYAAVLNPIISGKADVVYGSRFLGVHRAFLFWHYLGNKLLTFLTNIFYNTILTDMETGYKAFRREVIQSIVFKANRFEFEPEITAKVLKRRYKIYEVPISYSGRDPSEGKKITWRDGFGALWALAKYRFVD